MKNFYDVLNQYVSENHPSFGDGESVLTMLYEAYSECNRLDDAQIKADFNEPRAYGFGVHADKSALGRRFSRCNF